MRVARHCFAQWRADARARARQARRRPSPGDATGHGYGHGRGHVHGRRSGVNVGVGGVKLRAPITKPAPRRAARQPRQSKPRRRLADSPRPRVSRRSRRAAASHFARAAAAAAASLPRGHLAGLACSARRWACGAARRGVAWRGGSCSVMAPRGSLTRLGGNGGGGGGGGARRVVGARANLSPAAANVVVAGNANICGRKTARRGRQR